MAEQKQFTVLTDGLGVNHIPLDVLVEWFRHQRDKQPKDSRTYEVLNVGYTEWKNLADKIYASGTGLKVN